MQFGQDFASKPKELKGADSIDMSGIRMGNDSTDLLDLIDRSIKLRTLKTFINRATYKNPTWKIS
jgi:hypothetical protein